MNASWFGLCLTVSVVAAAGLQAAEKEPAAGDRAQTEAEAEVMGRAAAQRAHQGRIEAAKNRAQREAQAEIDRRAAILGQRPAVQREARARALREAREELQLRAGAGTTVKSVPEVPPPSQPEPVVSATVPVKAPPTKAPPTKVPPTKAPPTKAPPTRTPPKKAPIKPVKPAASLQQLLSNIEGQARTKAKIDEQEKWKRIEKALREATEMEEKMKEELKIE